LLIGENNYHNVYDTELPGDLLYNSLMEQVKFGNNEFFRSSKTSHGRQHVRHCQRKIMIFNHYSASCVKQWYKLMKIMLCFHRKARRCKKKSDDESNVFLLYFLQTNRTLSHRLLCPGNWVPTTAWYRHIQSYSPFMHGAFPMCLPPSVNPNIIFMFISKPSLPSSFSLHFSLMSKYFAQKMTVLWIVAPCGLGEVYRRLGGDWCLHHQSEEQVPREELALIFFPIWPVHTS
jgi:hypothetical protein